jgi:hypothetical protein
MVVVNAQKCPPVESFRWQSVANGTTAALSFQHRLVHGEGYSKFPTEIFIAISVCILLAEQTGFFLCPWFRYFHRLNSIVTFTTPGLNPVNSGSIVGKLSQRLDGFTERAKLLR